MKLNIKKQRKPKGYWDKKNCYKSALKCKTKTEFYKKYSRAYSFSLKNGWLTDFCKHMIAGRKQNGYWTKERCLKVALKCKTKKEFRKKYPTAYSKVCKNGWIKMCCKHMIVNRKPNGYWTKEKCLKIALNYKSKTEFQIKNFNAHKAASRKGWLDECCSHMKPTGNRYKRLIYVALFEDNFAYVGLTYNPKLRFRKHLQDKNIINKHIKNTGLKPKFLILTDFLKVEEAQKKEEYFKQKYEKQGYKILNIAKTGSVGSGIIKWTKKECHKKALKCKTYTEFKKKYGPAYASATRNGWLKYVCSHIKKQIKPNGYWTKKRCLNKAKKCKSRKELREKYGSAYTAIKKNGWLKECCGHMPLLKKINGYWNEKSNCEKEAKKYKYLKDFIRESFQAYSATKINNWDDVTYHMIRIK